LCPRPRVLELTGHVQQRGRARLHGGVVRQQIGGALILAIGAFGVAGGGERFRELNPGVGVLVVELQGIAELQNRLDVPFLGDQSLARLEVLLLLGLRAGAGCDEQQECERRD
jgi:hypothetical protein